MKQLHFKAIQKLFLALSISVLITGTNYGQVNISAGNTITQNFDGMGTAAVATVPTGWKVDAQTSARVMGTYAAAVTATAQVASGAMSGSATSGIYNYGAGTASPGGSDRCLGGLSASASNRTINMYVDLLNNGGGSIASFSVSYNIEKYRTGTNAVGYFIQMYYSTDGITFTSAGANFLTSFAADATTAGYVTAPGNTVSVSSQTLAQTVNASSHLYLAWQYSVISGSSGSNAQGLGIDDVSITANAGASPSLSAGTMSASFGSVCINTTAGPQNFSLSGTNLDGSAVSVGTLSGYSYCLTSGGTYTSTLPVPYTAPTLSATTIFVKFTPTLVQSYNGNIPVSGGGGSASTAVVGSGINTLPSTASGAAGSIGSTFATVAGTVTATGCGSLSAYGIEYSTTNSFGNGTGTPVSSGNLSGVNFTSALTGLSPATTYYYHSYATNSSAGTAYGTQGTFTTSSFDPPIATAATNVANHSFDANWQAVSGATSYFLDVSLYSNFGFATPATDLFISEYVEGSGNNKYIEIYNGTGSSVSLSDYRLRLYANGASTATNDVLLSGTLASGSTIVYKNSSASVYGGTSTSNAAVNYNGNDAVALFKVSAASNVDIFGRIGEDPGTAWTGAGGYSTADKTLVRKSTITGGVTTNPGAGFPTLTTEWDLFTIDNVANLGSHSYTAFTSSFVSGYNGLSVSGLTSPVSGLTANTTYHYRVRATDGVNTSGNSNVIDVTTTCTAPVIGTCPSNITQCDNHVATWTNPTATGDPAATVVCSPASGSTFVTGTTTVTCTASNGCGTPSSCSFSVIINATPVIGTCPSNITQCDNHVVVFSTPTATGTPAATVTCSPASGSTFSTGTTSVTCTATNSCGSSSCSFNVTINTTPVIGACPADITQCNDAGICDAVVSFSTPTTTGSPAATVTCTPPSGSTFAGGNLGNTTVVTCTATNTCGSSSCSFNVTVHDCEAPVITVGASDMTVECDGSGNTSDFNDWLIVNWADADAADNCNSSAILDTYWTNNYSSFNYTCGNTGNSGPVRFYVHDRAGNQSLATNAATFTIVDTQAPVIGTCPSNITQCDNHVATWTDPIASDMCGATVACSPVSGSTFVTGTTTVTCTAIDCGGNTDACSFTVTINESPVIGSCPSNITQCDNHVATWTAPSATGTSSVVSCSPPPGSTFSAGTSSVICTAVNSCGSSSCSFSVTINETPVMGTCPSNITSGNDLGLCTAVANYSLPSASATPAASVSCSPSSGNAFAVGTNSVTCMATNTCGSSSCSFNVTVNDNELPVLQCANDTIIFTDVTPGPGGNHPQGVCSGTYVKTPPCPPNCTPGPGGGGNHIQSSDQVVATDNCGILSVTDNHPSNTYPVGTTVVTYTATDIHGNTATCQQNVTVVDNEFPVITCSPNITQCNPLVIYTTTATDNCTATVSCTPPSNTYFTIGTTTVNCNATDPSNNVSSCSFSVTIQTPSTAPTGAVSNAPYGQICSGGNVTLTASGGTVGTGAGYVWYEGGCGSGASIGTGASITITPLTNGTHSYNARIEGTCNNTSCASVAVDVISAPPSGTIHYTAALADGCVGAPAQTISVNAVSSCAFYRWTSTDPGVRFNGNASPFETLTPAVNVTFVSLPPAGASGWSICVLGGNACGNTNTICTWARATVSTPTAITGSTIGCPGSTGNAYSSAAVAGAASYQWTGSAGITVNGNGAQSITVDFSAGFVSGTLSVHGQNTCGANGANKTITISRTPATPAAISGANYPCPNASTSYSVAAVAGAASYTWTTSVPGAVVTGTTNSCSIVFPAIIPAGSSVSVTANSSCAYSSTVRSKGIASGLPNIPGNISGPSSGQCGQTGVSYSIGPVANATGYSWSTTCGTIVGPTNLSGISMDWAGNMTSCTMSVVSSNGCGSSGARTLVVGGAPNTPTAISGILSVCAGSVEQYCASGSNGASSYQWTVPAGAVILGPSNGACILVQWGATGGTIICKATNGCGISGSKTLAVAVTCRQTQVNNTVASLNAEVYPNPATEKATLKFTAASATQYHLNMTNVLGQNVLSADGTSTEGINMIELNLNALSKGVYTLSIMSGDDTEQIRVVIQ